MSVVPDAVKRNRAIQTTTAEVENLIKVWLRQSCDRAGGRKAEGRGSKRKAAARSSASPGASPASSGTSAILPVGERLEDGEQ